MFLRSIRPFTKAPSASFIQTPTRFVLPIRVRSFATATIETDPPSSTSTEEESSPLSSSSFETTTAASSTFTTPTPPRQLPYFVERNPFNNFGVYQQKKRGGNLKVTLLKKGAGDLVALKNDLIDALQLRAEEVSINNVTKHIMLKGHKRDAVIHFLRTMGF
ncbi:hypothetical protein MGN70_008622 [Eutypa lata]|nr:hypothetical protein MGN70_008622 [Eutypa lata]